MSVSELFERERTIMERVSFDKIADYLRDQGIPFDPTDLQQNIDRTNSVKNEDIGNIVKEYLNLAGKIYGQTNNTFIVSRDEYKTQKGERTGLHIGVLPPRTFPIFTEYVLSNQQDLSTLVEFAKRGIFKSLYCNICTIIEENNVARKNLLGDIVLETNPATILMEEISIAIDGKRIHFILGGSTSQYFYNHLLLSTRDHISTYLLFLLPNYFIALFRFMEMVNAKVPNAKATFNGTFGSDTWHAHVHITDQKLTAVKDVKKIVDGFDRQGLNNGGGVLEYEGSGMKVTYIVSKNIETAYDEVSRRMLNIFRIGRTDHFLTATVFVYKKYACTLMMLGKKQSGFKIGEEQFFVLYPGYVINTQGTKPTKSDIDRLISKIKGRKIFFDIDRSDISAGDVARNAPLSSSMAVELLQMKVFLFGGNICNVVQNLIQQVNFNFLDDIFITCASRSTIIKNNEEIECTEPIHALYKYVLTLFVICRMLGGQSYQELMQNKALFVQAIAGAQYYATKIFRQDDFTTLYFHGTLAQQIVRRTFQDLVLLGKGKLMFPETGLIGVSKNVNEWIDYKLNPIGAPSATGLVTKEKLKNFTDTGLKTDFIVKINKNPNRDLARAWFENELQIGLRLNKIRDKIPNFVMTLGGFSCNNNVTLEEICSVKGFRDNPSMDYILLEYVDAEGTLAEWLATQMGNPLYTIEQKEFLAMSIFGQLIAGLAYAYEKTGFTHYDLHSENALVYNFTIKDDWFEQSQESFVKKGEDIPGTIKPGFIYKIGNDKFNIPAVALGIIIDFGIAYINDLKENPPETNHFQNFGMTWDRPDPESSHFTLLMTSLIIIIQYAPDLFSDGNELRNNFITKFFINFLDANDLYETNSEALLTRLLLKRYSMVSTNVNEFIAIIEKARRVNPDNRVSRVFHYLPYNAQKAKAPFTSSLNILRSIGPYFTDPKIQNIYKVNLIYRWGDWDDKHLGVVFGKTKIRNEIRAKQKQNIQDVIRQLK